ncbi:MAG: hypothetical protein QM820_23925 [Minicystis sp.]
MSRPGERCGHPVLDAQKRAKICGKPATAERTYEGIEWALCAAHAASFDTTGDMMATPELPTVSEETASRIRAKWEAEQAKLPPHKRRTWEQACDDEEQDMGRKLRRSRRKGGP